MPDLSTIATLDGQLHELVRRRDNAQDVLLAALLAKPLHATLAAG